MNPPFNFLGPHNPYYELVASYKKIFLKKPMRVMCHILRDFSCELVAHPQLCDELFYVYIERSNIFVKYLMSIF